jgi:acyl-CoA synthetase (AMP-forming)/AMP-acid ligase II
MSYGELQPPSPAFASGLIELGLRRGERVAIYLEKRLETVVASFGTAAAGCVFVPLNPLLKAEQVAYIMRDCNVRALVTSGERLPLLAPALPSCHDLRHVILVNSRRRLPASNGRRSSAWAGTICCGPPGTRATGSSTPTWRPSSTPRAVPANRKASSSRTATWSPAPRASPSYLENSADDTLLAALPLSFDAGFSQLTTAFHVGARVVLLNYLLPQDVLKALARERSPA